MKNFGIREILAIYWSIVLTIMLIYIVIMFGKDNIQILTLLIGFITGSVGSLFGFYFMSTHKEKGEQELDNMIESNNTTTIFKQENK